MHRKAKKSIHFCILLSGEKTLDLDNGMLMSFMRRFSKKEKTTSKEETFTGHTHTYKVHPEATELKEFSYF